MLWRTPRGDRACIALILITAGAGPTAPSSLSTAILTEPSTLSLPRGDSAKLHCKVKHLGAHHHLVWRRGYDVLASDSLLLSPDPRLAVEKHGGSSKLSISGLTPADAGEYVCQVSLLEGLLSVHHSLEVLVGPSVTAVEPLTTVKEGEEATLQCEVGGNPLPTVTWTKQGGSLAAGAHPVCPRSSCLALPSVSRTDAGLYQCTASNGVGEPATASLQLAVLFPPSIRVEQEQVHSGPGSRLQLACKVEGEPTPSLTWYFGDNKVYPSAATGVSIGQSRQRHTLTVADTSVATFGNYSCVASNKMGTFKKYIEVHGRPTEATFQRTGSQAGRRSFQLDWKVQSFSRILEYRLLYRSLVMMASKMQAATSDWTNVIIPGSEAFLPGVQDMRWRLDNLLQDTNYECLVQARNEFGWSQPSKMFTFTTSQKNVQSPATQGLNWGGPASGAEGVALSQGWLLLGLVMAAVRLT